MIDVLSFGCCLLMRTIELRRADYRVAFSSLLAKYVISLHEYYGNHV